MKKISLIKIHLIFKWIFLAVLIVIIDLFLKYRIKENYEYGQGFGILNDFILIKNINLMRMGGGFRFDDSYSPATIIPIVYHLLFLVLFIRIQTIRIDKLFKLSTLFIFFGIAGNYIDRFSFSNGEAGYVQMDYIYIEDLSSVFFNLSSLLCYAGWIIFFITMIKKFKETKKIFSHGKQKAGMNRDVTDPQKLNV